MQALLLTSDGQVWRHDIEPTRTTESQALELINRRQGLLSITFDEQSQLFFGSPMPTLPHNAVATTIAGVHQGDVSAIHGHAVLITSDTEVWIERICNAQPSKLVAL